MGEAREARPHVAHVARVDLGDTLDLFADGADRGIALLTPLDLTTPAYADSKTTAADGAFTFAATGGGSPASNYEEIPLQVLLPAYMLSELKTAFLMGFMIFLPFLIIDLVVAAVTISMGMMMLPPAMISLPFKLLLFVLADGWSLVAQNLVAGFRI